MADRPQEGSDKGAIAEFEENVASLAEEARRELAEESAREQAMKEGREYIPPKAEEEEKQEEEEQEEDSNEESETVESEEQSSEEKDEGSEEPKEEEQGSEDFENSIVKSYIDETTMSEDKAKEIVDIEKKLAEKYKVPYNKDTQPILKAKRHGESKIGELTSRIKQLDQHIKHVTATQEVTVDQYVKAIEQGRIPNPKTGKLMSESEVVDFYKEYDPKLTANMEDEKIKEMAARQLYAAHKSKREQYMSSIKTNAKAKRVELLETLPEKGKEHIKEVRDVLNGMADEWILDGGFDIDYVIRTVRGGQPYDDLKASIEKIRDEAYQAGKKDSKVTAKKKVVSKGVSSGKSAPASTTKKTKITLSDYDKQVAISKYSGMSEDDAYEAYAEFLEYKNELTRK